MYVLKIIIIKKRFWRTENPKCNSLSKECSYLIHPSTKKDVLLYLLTKILNVLQTAFSFLFCQFSEGWIFILKENQTYFFFQSVTDIPLKPSLSKLQVSLTFQ